MTEPIGEQLSQARLAHHLSLEQAANATHIRLHYLKLMEKGDFSTFPSPAQGRGFLRAYAQYLNLDTEALLAALGGEIPTVPVGSSKGVIAVSTDPVNLEEDGSSEDASALTQIGKKLRVQRELLGFSLEDVERHTHVRQHYLRALEIGDLDALPSPVQGKGMLTNYANFLGMEAEPLLLRFADGLQERLAVKTRGLAPRGTTAPRPAGVSRARRFLSPDLLVVGGLVIFLAVFIGWGALRISAMRSIQQPTATVPMISDVLASGPTLPPTATQPPRTTPTSLAPGVEPQPTAEVTLPGLGDAAVQVYVVVRQRAWMQGICGWQGRIRGTRDPWKRLSLRRKWAHRTADRQRRGLEVYFNQTNLGILGGFGEVASRIFTVDGIITPTATITPHRSRRHPHRRLHRLRTGRGQPRACSQDRRSRLQQVIYEFKHILSRFPRLCKKYG